MRFWPGKRTCPYCGGKIQQEALKCRHCHMFLQTEGEPAKTCPICRMMVGVSMLLFMVWLVVFLGWF